MARTKQTAKKTTGAPAPRLPLGSLHARSFVSSSVTRHSTRVSGGGIGNGASGNNVRNIFLENGLSLTVLL